MANEAIELYKPWDEKKVQFPGSVSEKLDGVPMRLRNLHGHVYGYSRQNESITSVPHITVYGSSILMPGGSITGELYIRGMPFKDISGLVRKKLASKGSQDLVMYVHDADLRGKPDMPYIERMNEAAGVLRALAKHRGCGVDDLPIRMIPRVPAANVEAVHAAFEAIMLANPKSEGAVYHTDDKPYAPGLRRWVGMKLKPVEDIDAYVVGFEEAHDQFGHPKDMVGTVILEMNELQGGTVVQVPRNVGPGKMTAAERKLYWAQFKQGKWKPRMAQIHAMPDDSYEGLREGRWQRWRDDKSDPTVRGK